MYSLGYDRTLRVWETATGRQVGRLDLGPDKVAGTFHLSPGERWLSIDFVTPGRPVLRVWDLRSEAELTPQTLPSEFVHTSAFSPDGAAFAVTGGPRSKYVSFPASGTGWLVLWDPAKRSVRTRWAVPGGAMTTAFSADGRILVTGGFDGTVRVWEVATGTERRAFRAHDSRVFRVLTSPDGRHLASGGADGVTYVWDAYAVAAGEPINLNRAWSDPERVRGLVRALDSDRFAVREQATADLRQLGREAEPAIRGILETKLSAEARERLAGLLDKMPGRTLDELREERVVEALERIGTADAIKLLKEWAGNAKLRIAPSAGAAVRRLWKP